MEYIIGKDGNSLKKLTQIKNLKLIILAGQAKPTPPVGPALGQYGVNLMDFCKQFNDLTKAFKTTIPINTQIRINQDKTFQISLKAPSNTYFLKIAANKNNNSSVQNLPGYIHGRTVTLKQIYSIAIIRFLFTVVLAQQGSISNFLSKSALEHYSNLTGSALAKSLMAHFFIQPSGKGSNDTKLPELNIISDEMFKSICKNLIGSARSLKYTIISDL